MQLLIKIAICALLLFEASCEDQERESVYTEICDLSRNVFAQHNGTAIPIHAKLVNFGRGFFLVGDRCGYEKAIPLEAVPRDIAAKFNPTKNSIDSAYALEGDFRVTISGIEGASYLGKWESAGNLVETKFKIPGYGLR